MDFSEYVTQLKAKAAEFMHVFDRVNKSGAIAQADPKLATEREALLSKASKVKSSIEYVTGLIDRASNWLDEQGLNEVGQMGVLPLVPIAVIAAAVSAIGYWLSDAYVYLQKIEQTENLLERGLKPEQITKIVNAQSSTGLSVTAKSLTGLGIVGMLLFVGWKYRKVIFRSK